MPTSEAEVEALRTDNDRLKGENRRLIAKIAQMDNERQLEEARLKRKVKQMQNLLDSRDQLIKRMEQQMSDLRADIPKHARTLSGKGGDIGGLAAMTAELSALSAKVGGGGLAEEDEDEEEDYKPRRARGSDPLDVDARTGVIDRTPKIVSTSKGKIKRASMAKVDRLLGSRSTIEETLARGIIYDRPDVRTEMSVLSKSKEMAKRRVSEHVSRSLTERKPIDELRRKGIYKEDTDLHDDARRKRRASRILEATLNPKSRATMEDLSTAGITVEALFAAGTGVQAADLDAFGTDSRHGARDSGEFVPDDLDSDDEDEKVYEEQEEVNIVWTGLLNDPSELSFTEKQTRVNQLYGDRSDVEQLIWRGIIDGHPSLRPRMALLKRIRAHSQRVQTLRLLYMRRPKDHNTMIDRLIDLRILPRETVRVREIKKRRLSRQLESKLISRPTAEEVNSEMGYQVVDLTSLIMSYFIGASLAEAAAVQASMDPMAGPGDPMRFGQSARAIDMGGAGMGMMAATAMMGGAGGMGTGRRDSVGSDVSDLDGGEDGVEGLKDQISQLERDLDTQKRQYSKLEEREASAQRELDSLRRASGDAVSELASKSESHELDTQVTVEASMREIEVLQSQIASKDAYISALRDSFSVRGMALPSEDELRREIRERLTTFVIQRPSVEELRRRNILPDEEKDMQRKRVSVAVGAGLGTRSALDVLRSKGIYREAGSDLPTIEDEKESRKPKGVTGAAGGRAIAAVQEGLKAEISQLEAQIDDLQHEREQLRGQVDHLRNALDQERKRKASAPGGAAPSGPNQTVVDIIAAMEDRDWVGSALSYYNRDFERVKAESDEYQMGEFIKLMLRTQVKETSSLLEQLQGEIDSYKEQLSFREKKITDLGSELALARGRKDDVPAPSSSGGGADAEEVRELRSKVADLETIIDGVTEDKMRTMTMFAKEMDELRSELKRMGRMQRSCQTMGVAVFRIDG